MDLETRVAQLEGKVHALLMIVSGPAVSTPKPAHAAADPTIPSELHDVIREVAKGNRPLTRHLYTVALEMLADDLEPAVIARRLRDGESLP